MPSWELMVLSGMKDHERQSIEPMGPLLNKSEKKQNKTKQNKIKTKN